MLLPHFTAIRFLSIPVFFCLSIAAASVRADDEPILKIEAGGPQGYVTAVAFDPSGSTLYAAGWDKVVHVWRRDPQSAKWTNDPGSTLRLPIGPGLLGSINALSVSADGRWLAVGGKGIFRGTALFRQPGRVVPSEGMLTAEMRQDEGLIYVFDLQEGRVHPLRGHAGSIVALQFSPGERPVLVSAGRDWKQPANGAGQFIGLLKVWDVLHGKDQESVLGSTELSEPKDRRTSLAVRRVGAGLPEIEVGIGWGDERFRVWNVASNSVQEFPCGKHATTVAYSQPDDVFITSALNQVGNRFAGQLSLRKPGQTVGSMVLRHDTDDSFVIPRALTVGGRDATQQVVATVSRFLDARGQPRSPDRFILQAARLNAGKLSPLDGAAILWDVPATSATPTVAVSPDAKIIAVAGGTDNSVWLYRTDEIRSGKGPFQTLKNSGQNWSSVAFVSNEDRLGLLLRDASGQLIFDLRDQTVSREAGGWQSSAGPRNDWRITPQREGNSSVVVISRGNTPVSRATLPEGETVSAHVFLPRVTGDRRPTILAVASHLFGQPSLRLFNADSGATFRELTGHTQVINSLAVDLQKRLLASVAGDQTVCIWDLADADSNLGQHGMLPGVAVRTSDARPEEISIASVRDTAPAAIRSKLLPRDVLQQLSVDGQDRSWSTPREFFDTLWGIKPGTPVTLRVARQGKQTEVALTVGQGIDERKPMLSLFFANRGREVPDWIAWTPLGPYEANHRDAERFLGWHFNLGDDVQVTRFAPADEYRKTYYREGLIRELIENGKLPQPKVERPTAVNIRFEPATEDELTSGGTVHLRQTPRALHLYLGGLSPESVQSIEMTMDGQKNDQFKPGTDNEWICELPQADWNRGTRQCVCTVRTNEVPPQEFTYETAVRYTPRPPVVKSTAPAEQVVKQAAFVVEADFQSPAGVPLELQVIQNGRPLDPVLPDGADPHLEQNLTLQPGENIIEVVARNRGAELETREAETSRVTSRVIFRKSKAAPPKMVADRFEVFDKASDKWQPVSISDPNQPLVVTQSELTVLGSIRAAESPSAAHWSNVKGGAAEERQSLEWKAIDAGHWSFSQSFELKPGLQQLRFYSRSADSDEACCLVPVEFRPQLPKLQWDDSVVSGAIEKGVQEPPATIAISGKLILHDGYHPFETQVLLNDQPIGAPKIDLKRGTWSAEVPLRSGENRIQLALKNAWQATAKSDLRVWQYRRLPRIIEVKNSPVVREPYTEVTARIESPADKPLTQVTVGDRILSPAWIRQVEAGPNAVIWEATMKSVALRPGKNQIRVSAATADGRSPKDGAIEVQYDAAYWKPPAVEFANSAPAENVTTENYDLGFNIRSLSALRSTRVEINGKTIPDTEIKSEASKAGTQLINVAAKLQLTEGVNRVAVRVQNEGGEMTTVRQINFIPPPVRIRVASLEPEDDPMKAVKPVVGRDGHLTFPTPLTSGYARLRGTVEWNQSSPDSKAMPTEVRIWVNGFQQEPVKLQKNAAKQEFNAQVVLGESKQNLINIDLVGAPLDNHSRVAFKVDCLQPQAAQRLHLLVIGVDQTDAPALKLRALKAIGAEADPKGTFVEPLRTAGFFRVNVYRPLIGNVTFSDVFRLLLRVKSDLKIPVGPDATGKPMAINDVVMVYYEGGILVPEKQHFVLCTSEKFDANNRYSAVASDWLAMFFESMRGAQLAFIEAPVDNPPSQIPLTDWNHDSHAALLCYAWRRDAIPASEGRLLNAVDEALTNVGRLGEVEVELAKTSSKSPGLDYHRIVPTRLKSLVLSRR